VRKGGVRARLFLLAHFFFAKLESLPDQVRAIRQALQLVARIDRAGEPDGCGAGIRIDDDFQAVFKAAEFNDVGPDATRFECIEACADRVLLEFAANFLGQSGGFSEIADRATRSSGKARVGIKTQFDAFQVSGHGCPRE